jgi:hypothetical protein
MDGVREYLKGKKTYVIVAVLVLLVIIEKFLGIDIPGFDVSGNWLEVILGAAGLGTIRAGIAKTGK